MGHPGPVLFSILWLTFFQVLVLVERLDGVLLGEASERVDEMRAEVRVDVGRAELGRALPVDGPVGEVADDPLPAHGDGLALHYLGR